MKATLVPFAACLLATFVSAENAESFLWPDKSEYLNMRQCGSMATMDNRQPKVYEGGCQNLEFLVSDKRPNPAIYYHMGPADHMTIYEDKDCPENKKKTDIKIVKDSDPKKSVYRSNCLNVTATDREQFAPQLPEAKFNIVSIRFYKGPA